MSIIGNRCKEVSFINEMQTGNVTINCYYNNLSIPAYFPDTVATYCFAAKKDKEEKRDRQ